MLGFHSLMTCLRLSLLTNTIAPQVNPACGAPEGDPLSVVASVLMCLIWFLHVRKGKWWPMNTRCFPYLLPLLTTGKYSMNTNMALWKLNKDLPNFARRGNNIWTYRKVGLGLQTESYSVHYMSRVFQNQWPPLKTWDPFSVTLTRTRPMCLRKTDIKMQSNDSVNYSNFTFLSVTNYIWLWPQFYPNGDILVKPMWLIGRSCINFNGPLLILCGNSQ